MHHSFLAARISRGVLIAAALATTLIVCSLSALAAPALAAGHAEGSPWTATLGDSYISGEAGRWAGNTNESSSEIDALGPNAYANYQGETVTTDLGTGVVAGLIAAFHAPADPCADRNIRC